MHGARVLHPRNCPCCYNLIWPMIFYFGAGTSSENQPDSFLPGVLSYAARRAPAAGGTGWHVQRAVLSHCSSSEVV